MHNISGNLLFPSAIFLTVIPKPFTRGILATVHYSQKVVDALPGTNPVKAAVATGMLGAGIVGWHTRDPALAIAAGNAIAGLALTYTAEKDTLPGRQ